MFDMTVAQLTRQSLPKSVVVGSEPVIVHLRTMVCVVTMY